MDLVYLLIALVMSITLHEFAHALMGHYLGDDTARLQGRLSLNPLAHIDPMMTLLLPVFLIIAHSPVVFGAAKPVPFNPWAVRFGKWGAVLVALAGPATNLALALFFGMWLRLFGAAIPQAAVGLFVSIIVVNLSFFVFNLIPFPPLDGSRLVYAIAPTGVREVMERIERAGMVAVFLFLFIGYQFIGPVIGHIVQAFLNVIVPGVTQL